METKDTPESRLLLYVEVNEGATIKVASAHYYSLPSSQIFQAF